MSARNLAGTLNGAIGRGVWAVAWAVAFVTSATVEVRAQELKVKGLQASFDGRETFPGTTFELNREQGTMRGAALGLHGIPTERMSAEFEMSVLEGSVGYRGINQFGLPIRTTTDHTHLRIEAWMGSRDGFAWGLGRLQGSLGAALHGQSRRIRASAGNLPLTERLSSLDLIGRTAYSHPLGSAPLSAWLRWELAVSAPLTQRLEVDSHGAFDVALLQPGRRMGWRGGVLATCRLRDADLSLGWSARHTPIGRSKAEALTRGGQPAGILEYPGARQWLRTLTVQVAWVP